MLCNMWEAVLDIRKAGSKSSKKKKRSAVDAGRRDEEGYILSRDIA